MTSEERRAALVEATLPLLRESGGAVTTKEIAAAAGVAEGTVFRAFETKDELMRACVGQVMDTSGVRAALREVDRSLPLADRLIVGVELMQHHVEGIVSLMSMLHTTGVTIPRPEGHRGPPRRRGDPEVDAELVALIGPDAAHLRVPVDRTVAYLSMLTLASVHPFLPGTKTSPAEVVDVLLNGVLSPDTKPCGTTESETR